jgi:hypothetical protein
MTVRTRSRLALLLAALSVATTARAGKSTDIEVKPGPAAMSEAEKAIVADPASGAQHGVVLLEETERNDSLGAEYQIDYHMRAKILSAEGRGLADVAIPVDHGMSDLVTWWGRTILPDGRVLELPKDGLKAQPVIKSWSLEEYELKGALPGVVPGAVVDYGYVVRGERFARLNQVYLQSRWPARTIRYRWIPSTYLPAAYVALHTDAAKVKIKNDRTSVLVTAVDQLPVEEEPYMPPRHELLASVSFYYSDRNESLEDYWNLTAKRIETDLKEFSNAGAIRDAIHTIAIPAGAPMQEVLRTAYDWIAANVKNTGLESAEEEEAADKKDKDVHNAKTVLKAKEGSPRQLDYLFAGIARALGADAQIVFTTDRSDRYWAAGLKTLEQFGYSFVAVRGPGEGDDKWVLVDPGSGLPYGEVPWRGTGTMGFLCGAKGWAQLGVPPAPPAKNRSETRVTISFSDVNETILAKWSRTALGASGMDMRRWLRDLDPAKRKKELDRLCGAHDGGEVSAAVLPGLDEVSAPYQIGCDVEVGESNLTESIGRYSLTLLGAWSEDAPDLPSTKRQFPVVFEYPRAETASIDVVAPHGFKPKDPPAPVTLRSPYGAYQLTAAKTATGYHVERAFTLFPVIVKPPDYAVLKQYVDAVRKADRTAVVFDREGAAP